jgi:hypothetical protein
MFSGVVTGCYVGHVPVQLGQLEQAVGQASGMPQAQAEHAFQGQAELDGRIAEDFRPASAPAGCSLPLKLAVKPNHKRAATFERGVVSRPVRCVVSRQREFAHPLRLPKSHPQQYPGRGVMQQRLPLAEPKANYRQLASQTTAVAA